MFYLILTNFHAYLIREYSGAGFREYSFTRLQKKKKKKYIYIYIYIYSNQFKVDRLQIIVVAKKYIYVIKIKIEKSILYFAILS